MTYVIGAGTCYVSMVITGTDPASWQALEAEVDRMARSIVITAGAPTTGAARP